VGEGEIAQFCLQFVIAVDAVIVVSYDMRQLIRATLLLFVLLMLTGVTCDRSVVIEFRGGVYDATIAQPIKHVEVWCLAVYDGDSIARFPNHDAVFTNSAGGFQDQFEFSGGGGCDGGTADDILYSGALFKFQKAGYVSVDTLVPRKNLLLVSGYYLVPDMRMMPMTLKNSSNRPGGGR
jgi:hypothetical protein